MKRIAINGMGRIGRASLKIILETPELEVVAVNDIAPIENISYLLKYDSAQGKYTKTVSTEGDILVIGNSRIPFYKEKDPENLPWKDLGVDTVIESTGIFTSGEDASKHITAGASTVVISGPTKSSDIPTIVHGVNSEDGHTNITPIIEILGRRIGIKKAILTTVHADTASNSIVDSPSGNFRMGRSGLNNLIPATTGAAIATTKAIPGYTGKFDGMAIRVPVVVGSLSDITIVTERNTSVEEVNNILMEEANTKRYRGIFKTVDDPIVSSDIIKDSHASIADLSLTKVVDGDLLKIVSWYDNEWGFANQMIRQILENG
jgi:glyceraldehyde 3-phosphate dehydrogenase